MKMLMFTTTGYYRDNTGKVWNETIARDIPVLQHELTPYDWRNKGRTTLGKSAMESLTLLTKYDKVTGHLFFRESGKDTTVSRVSFEEAREYLK